MDLILMTLGMSIYGASMNDKYTAWMHWDVSSVMYPKLIGVSGLATLYPSSELR